MSDAKRARLVWASDRPGSCPRCGWPAHDCRCAAAGDQAVPARVAVRLRVEKAGRGGKTVTVVDNLPRNRTFLADLAAELKRSCGTGGTAREAGVELQGDHRAALRTLLAARGWTVKG